MDEVASANSLFPCSKLDAYPPHTGVCALTTP